MSGVMNVPLSAGATLVVLPRFGAPRWRAPWTSYRVTRLFGVPTMFIALLARRGGPARRLLAPAGLPHQRRAAAAEREGRPSTRWWGARC